MKLDATQSNKPVRSKYEDKGAVSVPDEGPLDDPLAEKMRKQRCAQDAALARSRRSNIFIASGLGLSGHFASWQYDLGPITIALVLAQNFLGARTEEWKCDGPYGHFRNLHKGSRTTVIVLARMHKWRVRFALKFYRHIHCMRSMHERVSVPLFHRCL